MSEARRKLAPGLTKKQLVTSLLTRSSSPFDPSLDRALKLKLPLFGPGTLKLHAQEVRSFIRNTMSLGVHAGHFRNWGFVVFPNDNNKMEEDSLRPTENTTIFEADSSTLADALRDMYFLPRMHAPRDESGTKQGKMIIDHWV